MFLRFWHNFAQSNDEPIFDVTNKVQRESWIVKNKTEIQIS